MEDPAAGQATESHIPRLQQCFLRWLAENARRFVRSPYVMDRTERMIEMSLVGTSPAITARLTVDQLLAETGGSVLVCFDLPKRNTGYTCGAISPLYTRVDGTDEDMWNRNFERFLAWANRQHGPPV
ncbi:hypothetical protein [Azospirillum sp. A39]|uniref:hypothetical protein n=2 Tax=unclassified Azospirillum TaxID=2630922 RepID=UPI0040459D52